MKFPSLLLALCAFAAANASSVVKVLHSESKGNWKANIEYRQFRGSSALVRFANARIAARAKKELKDFLELASGSNHGDYDDDGVCQVMLETPNVISVRFTFDSYAGGAHPNVSHEAMNFGIVNGKPKLLHIEDIVSSTKALIPLVHAGFRKDMKDRQIDPSSVSIDDARYAMKSFAITRKGLEFLYDAIHAIGSMATDIPWRRVKNIKAGSPVRSLIK